MVDSTPASRHTHTVLRAPPVPGLTAACSTANFALPEKGNFLDEVVYAALDEEEAKKVVETFQKDAKAAGLVKEKEKRERSTSEREGPPSKRQRGDDRRAQNFPREDRRPPRDFGRDRGQSCSPLVVSIFYLLSCACITRSH